MVRRFAFIRGAAAAAALLSAFLVQSVCAQPPAILQEGIRQYQADNYEEAAALFEKARAEDPRSSEAAFWLGLTYKQQGYFEAAVPPLTDAVSLAPPIKEAIVELIDVLYRLDKREEAKHWIAVAERGEIYPAKTAFLKGMVLSKDALYPEAIAAFEQAKTLDASFTQAADFQIGLAYMLDRKYEQAIERFRASVTQDPVSDLASFARRYQDLVEERSWIERPLRLTLNAMGQYDTNMLQEPYAHPGLPDAGDEKSLALLSTLRLDFVPTLSDGKLFNASYAASNYLHEKNATSYDLLVNSFTVAPGYGVGRVAVNLLANYAHTLKRNPSYKPYSEVLGVGPLVRVSLTQAQDHILEIYGGYAKKHYFTAPIDPNENQNAAGLSAYVSWMWLLKNRAIVNLKYGFTTENADGNNWTNRGHRFTFNSIFPLWNSVKLQLGAEVFLQEFANESTIPAFDRAKRRDTNYMGIAGLTWDVGKNLSLVLQYTGIRDSSNIFVYDFNRNIYSVGAELRL